MGESCIVGLAMGNGMIIMEFGLVFVGVAEFFHGWCLHLGFWAARRERTL